MSANTAALLIAIPSLIVAITGLLNGIYSKKEVQGRTEQVWMTLTKESTDLVLSRLEELKRENVYLKKENRKCSRDMEYLRKWLTSQGIRVPPLTKDEEIDPEELEGHP